MEVMKKESIKLYIYQFSLIPRPTPVWTQTIKTEEKSKTLDTKIKVSFFYFPYLFFFKNEKQCEKQNSY
jgi:hypothetical protein